MELDDSSTFDRPLSVYNLKVVGGGGYFFESRLHFHRKGSGGLTCVLEPIVTTFLGALYSNRASMSLSRTSTIFKATAADRTPYSSSDNAWHQNVYIRSIGTAANLNNYQEGYYFLFTQLTGKSISNFFVTSYKTTHSRVLVTTPDSKRGNIILASPAGTTNYVEQEIRVENIGTSSTRISYISVSGITFSLVNTIRTPYTLSAGRVLVLRVRMTPYTGKQQKRLKRSAMMGPCNFITTQVTLKPLR